MVMVKQVVRQARKMHREAVEAFYDGRCGIYEMRSEKDPETKVTRQVEALVQDGVPCRLSYSSVTPAMESGTITTAAQTIKLFLAPERVIPPGCRIEVSQQGKTESYGQSGKAAVYSSHQEILLELWRGYA